jgi:hypothetical protein
MEQKCYETISEIHADLSGHSSLYDTKTSLRMVAADADGNVLRSSSRTGEGQAGTCRESETRMLI